MEVPEDGGRLVLDGPVWLEIGFGGGEHLAWQAERHPDVTVIGVEPYLAGVAKLLTEIERHDLGNVRVVVDDARLLLAALPDRSISRCFVLFADPWPKKRHWKRRIIDAWTLAELSRVLTPDAELRIATDHGDYLRWILERTLISPELEWLAESAEDWRVRSDDWPATRYEEKAIREGRRPVFLRFRKRFC